MGKTNKINIDTGHNISDTKNKPIIENSIVNSTTFNSSQNNSPLDYKPCIRTEIIIKNPDDRKTSEIMTKFEYTRISSIRAAQIEKGAIPTVDVGHLTDPLEISKLEISMKECPLGIIRMLNDTEAEFWSVNEMVIYADKK